jgi:hypothetical protein
MFSDLCLYGCGSFKVKAGIESPFESNKVNEKLKYRYLLFMWTECLEWCRDEERCVVSDSTGQISVVRLPHGAEPVVERQLQGHAYEAWTACWSYYQDNILYSGGDDSRNVFSSFFF